MVGHVFRIPSHARIQTLNVEKEYASVQETITGVKTYVVKHII